MKKYPHKIDVRCTIYLYILEVKKFLFYCQATMTGLSIEISKCTNFKLSLIGAIRKHLFNLEKSYTKVFIICYCYYVFGMLLCLFIAVLSSQI